MERLDLHQRSLASPKPAGGFMRSDALATLSRRGVAVMSALLISVGLRAQSASAAPRAPAVNAETALFFDNVSMSASLEYVLLGIPGLTDAQRERVEALEASTRERIARVAQHLRDARRKNISGWPSERDLQAGVLSTIGALRDAGLDRARVILDESQQRQFDRNRLTAVIAAEGSWLDAGDVLWLFYLMPYRGTSSVGPSVPD
jgi:hypothetical protein